MASKDLNLEKRFTTKAIKRSISLWLSSVASEPRYACKAYISYFPQTLEIADKGGYRPGTIGWLQHRDSTSTDKWLDNGDADTEVCGLAVHF